MAELIDPAMRAFVQTLAEVAGTAPTHCPGWTAHDVAAHVAAAAQERADLIEERLAGRPPRPTRPWEVREPPMRALAYDTLRERLAREAVRFEVAAVRMGPAGTLEYTGWLMTAERLRTHAHSEAALHRWDLVGADETGRALLSAPELTEHALAVFANVPALDEARRWVSAKLDGQVRLRAAGQHDLLVTPGLGLSLVPPEGPAALELRPDERLLLIWGRHPWAEEHLG